MKSFLMFKMLATRLVYSSYAHHYKMIRDILTSQQS